MAENNFSSLVQQKMANVNAASAQKQAAIDPSAFAANTLFNRYAGGTSTPLQAATQAAAEPQPFAPGVDMAPAAAPQAPATLADFVSEQNQIRRENLGDQTYALDDVASDAGDKFMAGTANTIGMIGQIAPTAVTSVAAGLNDLDALVQNALAPEVSAEDRALGLGQRKQGTLGNDILNLSGGMQKRIQLTTDWMAQPWRDRVSEQGQVRGERFQREQEAARQEEAKLRKQDIANGSSEFMADLADVGRGFMRTAAAYAENPSQIAMDTAENLPQLGATVALGGTSILGNAAVAGAMEASGMYQQVKQDMDKMSDEDLLRNSAQAQQLQQQGYNMADIRDLVLAQAVGEAAPLQFGATMLAAPLGGKLETGLAGKGFGTTAASRFRNRAAAILGEGADETINSATGGIAANLAAQQNYDPNKRVLEDVGEQAAQGGLVGMGMGGVMAAPGQAVDGAILTARQAGRGALSALGALKTTAEARRTNNAENVEAEADAAEQKADFKAAVAAFDPTVGVSDAKPTENPQTTTEPSGDLGNTESGDIPAADTAGDVAPAAVSENIFSPEGKAIVQALASTGLNDAQQLDAVNDVLQNNPDLPAEQRRALEIYANDKIGELLNHLNGPLTQAFQAAPKDSAEQKAVGAQMQAISTMLASSETKRFMEAYNEENLSDEEFNSTIAALPANITQENLNSPEVQAGFRAIKEKSLYRPLDVSTEQYQQVLDNDTSLSPIQRQLLEAKKSLADFVATQEAVADNVRNISRPGFKSVRDHALGVVQAMQRKDAQGVQTNLDALRKFAETEQARFKEHDRITNLVNITGLASDEYTAVPGYYRLDSKGNRGGEGRTKLQFVNPRTPTNIQNIERDTNHIVDVYNALLASVPSAQGQSLMHVKQTWTQRAGGTATAQEIADFQQEVQNRKTASQNNTANEADANAQPSQTPVANANTQVPEASGATVEPGVRADESQPAPSTGGRTASSEPAASTSTVQPDVVPAAYSQPALSEADARELPDDQISDLMTEAQTHIAEQGFDQTAQDNFRTLSDEMARRAAEPTKPEMNVWAGTGENAQFSNLAVRPFTYEGRQYNSVEHAYQSNKSGQFDADTYAKYDMNAKGTVKKIAGRKGTDRNGSQALMETLIRESFQQNPEAHAALREAGAENTFTHKQDKGYWGKAFPELLQTIASEEVIDTKDNTVDSEKAAPIGQQVLEQVPEFNEANAMAENANQKAATTNWFRASFQPRANAVTNYALGMFKSLDRAGLYKLLGQKAALSADTMKGFADLNEIVDGIGAALNSRLQTVAKKQNVIGKMNTMFPVSALAGMKMLHMTKLDANGNLQYIPEAQEAVSLAATHWLLSGEDVMANVDEKLVARILGISEDEVTAQNIVDVMNSGVPMVSVVQQIAGMMEQLLGIQLKADASRTYGRNVTASLAYEAVAQMEKLGLIKYVKVPSGDSTVNMIKFTNTPAINNLKEQMKGNRKIIQKALLPDTPTGYSVGANKVKTETQANGNTWQKIPPKVRQSIENQQAQGYRLVKDMYGLMQAMGDSFLNAAGFYAGDLTSLNAQHRAAVESTNQGLVNAKNAFDEVMAEIENQAIDGAVEEVPVHFSFDMDTNGRTRMNASYNPQSSKVWRELLTTARAEVDVTSQQSMREFWLHVAQGLDIKVDKMTNDQAIKEVRNLLATDTGIQAAISAMTTGLLDGWDSIGSKGVDAINAAVAGDLQNKAKGVKYLHALLSAAKHDVAMLNGDNTFTHEMTFEVDGVTDGPGNSFVHFAMTQVKDTTLSILSKIGWAVNRPDSPSNDKSKQPAGQVDLYVTAANNITEDFLTAKQTLDAMKKAGKLKGADFYKWRTMQHMGTLLSAAGMADVDNQNQITKMSRSFAKVLVTPATYGSGKRAMSAKVMNTVIEEMYKQISQAINIPEVGMNQQLLQALDTLGDTKEFTNLMKLDREGALKFQVREKTMEQLHRNMRNAMADILYDGVDAAVGNALKTNRELASLVNVQSLAFKGAWENEYNRLREQRIKEGVLAETDMLSQADEDVVTKAVEHLAPIYLNGVTGNDMADGFNMLTVDTRGLPDYLDRSVVDRARISNFDGKTDLRANGTEINSSGVRSVALSTIAGGDATMMTVFFDAIKRNGLTAQNVYDGLDTKLGEMEAASDAINAAVREGWSQDLYYNMMTGLQQGLKNIDYNSFGENVKRQLYANLSGVQSLDDASYTEVKQTYPDLNQYAQVVVDPLMKQHAAQARANKYTRQALLEVYSTYSHMGGVDKPVNLGTVTYLGSDAEVAEAINARAVELRKADTEAKLQQEKNQKSDKDLVSRFNEYGAKSEDGLTLLSKDRLLNALATYEFEGNRLNRELYKRLAVLLPADLQVHFGDADTVSALQTKLFLDVQFNGSAKGTYYGGHIFLRSANAEVLLHESIHAAVGNSIFQYYVDPSVLTAEQQTAVRNLESLMNQFNTLSQQNADFATRTSIGYLQANLNKYLRQGDTGGALNEFVAWTLANQNLQGFLGSRTNTNAETRVKTSFTEFFRKVRDAVLKLLGLPLTRGQSVLESIAGNFDNLVTETARVTDGNPYYGASLTTLNQALDHSTILPDHQNRLADLVQRLEVAMDTPLKQTGELLAQTARERSLIQGNATKINKGVQEFLAAGWSLSPQEEHAFRLTQAVLSSGIQLNPTAMNAMQRLYDSVMPTLTVNDMSQTQLDALKGKGTIFVDGSGRTNQLANFIALGMTSEQFRKVLAERDIPRREQRTGDFMEKMSQATKDFIDYMADLGNGTRTANNAATALDVLAEKIAHVQQQTRDSLIDRPTNLLGRADAGAANIVKKVGEKAGDLLKQRVNNGQSTSKRDTALNNILAAVSLMDKEGQGQEALQSALNDSNLWTPLFELFTEALGSDKSSVQVNRLLQQAKNQVSAVRQKIRDGVPANIKSKFTRELKDHEWTAMTRAFGKTDMQSLLSGYTMDDIHSYLKDAKALQNAVTAAESAVMKHASGADYVVRAKELAHYMMTGENISDHLLRNATAISELVGTGKAVQGAEKAVQNIDHLVSLYAMQQLTDAEKATMDSLFQNERAGLDFVSNYLKVMNANEQVKLGSYNPHNAFKGHVPALTVGHKNLVVADATVGKNLVQNHGYSKVPGYETDSDLGNNKLSYYYTTESLTAGYTQGALQTVEPTVYGTDPVTGRTVHLRGSFGLSGDAARAMARQKAGAIQNATLGTTPGKLMPVVNFNGEITGYEAAIPDAMRNEMLGANTNLAEMLGVWQGRQAEESLAQRFNEVMANQLADIWKREDTSRKGEYIDLAKSAKTNKVHAETWEAVPRAAQDMLKAAFGGDPVMVRKDMLNNAFGYRNFSVSALFTQQSELPTPVQEGVVALATAIMGAKAPRYLRKAGRYTTDAVSVAKDWIIVRSVSVFAMNLLGNFVQLGQNGVGLKAIFKGQAAKMQEVDAFLRNVNKMNQLHSDNLGSTDPVQIKRNKMAIQRLHDANSRMSIAPLIEAGELPTVAEGLSIDDDNALRGGALNWIEQITDRVPKGVSDAVKLAMIAKGTPLHNGLNRMMTYGDFVAKAVLFDKLTQQDGLSKDAALKVIQEEFINYDNNPGRTRTWFESHGFSWFLTYKLKIQKILLRRMRDNPLSTLVYQGVADGLGIDSPFEANVFGDNFWYSLSDPTRVLDAPSLHPVAQLLR